MQITLDGKTYAVKGVQGPPKTRPSFQGAQREWLDIIFDLGVISLNEVDALFADTSGDMVITGTRVDPETEQEATESFIHRGYSIRGPVTITEGADGREATVRQYQRTAMEDAVAELRAAQDAMMEGIV